MFLKDLKICLKNSRPSDKTRQEFNRLAAMLNYRADAHVPPNHRLLLTAGAHSSTAVEENNNVTLESLEGDKFQVSTRVAKKSNLLKTMIGDPFGDPNDPNNTSSHNSSDDQSHRYFNPAG